MPSCPYCGNLFVCGCGQAKPVAQTTQPCPLKKGALWVHVVDDTGADVKGAAISIGGTPRPTDDNGLAAFDPLNETVYDVTIGALTDPLDRQYELPAEVLHKAGVTNGHITYVAYELKRRPRLTVEIKYSDRDGPLDAAADIEVQSPRGTRVQGAATRTVTPPFLVPPGTYYIHTTLPKELDGCDVDADQDKAVTVAGPDDKVSILVAPAGELKVLVTGLDTKANLDGVSVTITGPKDGSGDTVNGLFTVPQAGKGRYTITLALAGGLADRYGIPTIAVVDLAQSQKLPVPVVLPVRPAPKIEIDDPRIIIVRHAYHGKPRPGVTAHRVAVKLSATADCDGEGIFTAPADIEVFDRADSTSALPLPLIVASGDLKGRTVFLEAKSASAVNKGTELRFELRNSTIPPRPPVVEKITCVKLTLEGYAARVPPSSDPAKLADDVKIDPGRPVAVGAQLVERAKIVLKQAEPADFDGSLILETIAANLEVYDTEKPASGDVAVTALTFDNVALAAGRTLWVQGTGASAAAGDTGWRVGVAGVTAAAMLVEGDRVTMTAFTLALDMFRGDSTSPTVLQVAPFYCTDHAAELDGALPLAQQNRAAATRPSTLDAAFQAPRKDAYGENAAANADQRVFRLRVKPVPSLDVFTQQDTTATIKLLSKTGAAITWSTVGAYQPAAGTAGHANGMPVILRKNTTAVAWLSPYLRALTMAVDNRSKMHDYSVVHSIPPLKKDNMEDGKQFGRKIRVTTGVCGAQATADFTLGGKPYATIPVKFLYVSPVATPPTAEQTLTAKSKIHQLNQYWASSGLEFTLADPGTAIHHVQPPPRNLITIGEFTGCREVLASAFTVTIDFRVTLTGQAPAPVQIVVGIDANRSSAQVAADIQAALRALRPGGALAGLTLDADIFDLGDPRLYLSFDLQVRTHDLTTGPLQVPLPAVGTHGPVDVVITGGGVPVSTIQITGLATSLPADISAPPMTNIAHDAMILPPCATTRHYVRTLSPTDKKYVSVLVENPAHENKDVYRDAFCENGFCGLFDASQATMRGRFDGQFQASLVSPGGPDALTLMNAGAWIDDHARLICYLRDRVFSLGADDVQHEMGHALAGFNHTIDDPDWFYSGELLHLSSGKPSNKTIRMSSQEIFVTGIVSHAGAWHAAYVSLTTGYGGAARAGIQQLPGPIKADWLVTDPLDPTQLPW